MQRRVIVVRDIEFDEFRSRGQPVSLRIGFAVKFGNAFLLTFYSSFLCIQRLAQGLSLLDRLVNLRLIAVPKFCQLLPVSLYSGVAIRLQLLYLLSEPSYLLVFGRKVFSGFCKVAFAKK